MTDLSKKSQQELLSPWDEEKACALSSIFSNPDKESTDPPSSININNDLCNWFNKRQDCKTLCFADIALFNLLQDAGNKAFQYILATYEQNVETYDRIIQEIANCSLALSKEFVEGLCQVTTNNYCVPQYYICKNPSSTHDTNTQSSSQKEIKVWIKDFQSSPNSTPAKPHSKAEDLAKQCADIFFKNPLTDQCGQEMKVVYFIPLAPARPKGDRPIPLGQFFIGFSDEEDTQKHEGLIRDIVLFIYYQYSSLATAKVANDKNKQMKKLFSDLMRTTRTIDVFARMFAISLDAFDDFKDFREKLGFISYEFLSQDKRNFSFVLVPKENGTGYYYSNYEIPDNSCPGKKYFEVYKKSGSNNDVEECFEVKKCFDELVNAWGRSQLTDCSTHLFQHVIFADINENDNTKNSSSDENVRNYKNTIASIINEHSISRAIKKNKPNPQGEWLGFAPEVATKDHKLTYTYRPYAYWNKKCAVVSGFRNDNDLRMIIMIGMKEEYFTEDDNATIRGLIEKIWEHQLRYLAESTLDSFTNIDHLNKFAKIFENLKRETTNDAHPVGLEYLKEDLIVSFGETQLFPSDFFDKKSPYLNFYKALSGPYTNPCWKYANYMLGYNYSSDYNFGLNQLSVFLENAIKSLQLENMNFTSNNAMSLISFPCYRGYEFIHKLLNFLHAINADCKTHQPKGKIDVSVEYDENLVKIRLKGLDKPEGLITKTAGAGCSGAREELRYCSSAGQVPVVSFACEEKEKEKDFLIVWYSAVSAPQNTEAASCPPENNAPIQRY